jgi:hypothetical protein
MPAKPSTTTPAKKSPTKAAAKTAAKTAAPTSRPSSSKPAVKPAAVAKVASKTVSKVAPARTTPPAVVKPKKPKLVRDSFTIPKDEFAVVDELKLRAGALGHPIKKSELLRAGLKLLASMADGPLLAALQAIPSIKTGRPKAEPSGKPEKKA